MMKILILLALALLSLVGTVAGLLLVSGGLNMETIQKLMGKEMEMETAPTAVTSDSLSGLAQQLRMKGDELAKREKALNEREAQINKRELELADLRTEVESIQQQIQGSLESAESDRATQLKTVAISIGSMKSDKAAMVLSNYPPEDAAAILKEVPEKERAKIFDNLETAVATKVFQAMGNSLY